MMKMNGLTLMKLKINKNIFKSGAEGFNKVNAIIHHLPAYNDIDEVSPLPPGDIAQACSTHLCLIIAEVIPYPTGTLRFLNFTLIVTSPEKTAIIIAFSQTSIMNKKRI